MPIRKAQAAWHGTFRDGAGKMRLGSGAFEGAYNYRSRMEDSEPGTNPEELLGAAHAGCFSMSLARRLTAEGYSPERINTEARVRFGRSGEGYAISRIDLRTEAEVPGVDVRNPPIIESCYRRFMRVTRVVAENSGHWGSGRRLMSPGTPS